MTKKRPLKEGETRCVTCDTILKDEYHSITTEEQVLDIIANTNVALISVRWLLHQENFSLYYTVAKIVRRRKKDGNLMVDQWWEAEFIVKDAPSVKELVKQIKAFWIEHPLDSLSKEAKSFQEKIDAS